MATIFVVHGTSATGPLEGEAWWQLGSRCEKHLRQLVTADDGHVDWKPIIWDGRNSESSRRNAGKLILDRIRSDTQEYESFAIIGHSHGGSCIYHALISAAHTDQALPHLSTWITVGTPFIETRRPMLLFSRLGMLGKAIYIPMFWTVLVSLAVSGFTWSFSDLERPLIILYVLGSCLPLALFHLVMFIRDRRLEVFWHRAREFLISSGISRKWVPLRHAADEAVAALTRASSVHLAPVPSTFAVNPLLLMSVLVPPLIMLMLSSSEEKVSAWFTVMSGRQFDAMNLPFNFSHSPPGMLRNLNVLMWGAIDGVFEGVSGVLGVDLARVVATLSLPAALCGIGIVSLYVFSFVSRAISSLLSRAINQIITSQLLLTSFGSDRADEICTSAAATPAGWPPHRAGLPQQIAEEIVEVSDLAAKQSISKIRFMLSEMAAAGQSIGNASNLRDLFTSKELIHCSYFDAPRFRKLVAYFLCQSTGFRATAAFEADPDYELIANWHQGFLIENTE